MKRNSSPSWLVATWFGCGYAPKGPGTAGSLAAVVIAWPLMRFAGFGPWHFLVLSLVLLYPGIRAADVVARESGLKDPQIVVVDEVLGQWLTLAGGNSMRGGRLNWLALAIGFGLFRLFDIWKPPPIRRLEKLPGGTGIVLDDMMAGVYGAVVLFALGWFNLY